MGRHPKPKLHYSSSKRSDIAVTSATRRQACCEIPRKLQITKQQNTTCSKSTTRGLQENICCGYRALTEKRSLHILYHYKVSFDLSKSSLAHTNFSASFTSFSQRNSPSMNKERKEGSISSLQDSLYQKIFCLLS